jgi:hypothetical protein
VRLTEPAIAGLLCRQTFQRKCLLVLPNCYWTGDECDLLAVTMDRRVIDVEIKISRADLKADAAKSKWFHNWNWATNTPGVAREWPRKVWKHYYCMPRAIWKPELLDAIAPVSGVLLVEGLGKRITCERRAKPCRDADRITADDVLDIARLAGRRMWDASAVIERMKNDGKRMSIAA